ncbi:MAG: ATP-binding cassette domain-containing protein [Sedimenticola sp.]|nr:ATP-binding cassette domain-containing protein [Sedimenticola sp.]
MPLLTLKQVVKTKEHAGSRFQLLIPDLVVEPGEFVAVVGESGCGKSTLLDLLALISRPDSVACYHLVFSASEQRDVAKLWMENDEVSLADIRRQYLGYVLQTGGLLPYLNVRKNLLLPMNLNRLPDGLQRVVDMAQRMGVSNCLHRLPESLSGGQRQRVAILRALSHSPRLVLADEPTAAVDKRRAKLIVEDFRSLARDEGLSIIMVTHDLDLVQPVADTTYGFHVTQYAENEIHSVCSREIP